MRRRKEGHVLWHGLSEGTNCLFETERVRNANLGLANARSSSMSINDYNRDVSPPIEKMGGKMPGNVRVADDCPEQSWGMTMEDQSQHRLLASQRNLDLSSDRMT